MPKVIEAIYENGVFKPLQKVNFRPGSKVRIVIQRRQKRNPAKIQGCFRKSRGGGVERIRREVML